MIPGFPRLYKNRWIDRRDLKSIQWRFCINFKVQIRVIIFKNLILLEMKLLDLSLTSDIQLLISN